MRARFIIGWVVVLSLVAAIGYAQQPMVQTPAAPAAAPAAQLPPARTLSLAEALTIARENSPDYRSVLNNRWSASSANTNSLFQLITPTASLSGSRSHNGASSRSPGAGIPPQQYPAVTSYSWGLNLNYNFSGSTITNRGVTEANLRLVDADIAGAQTQLESNVRLVYLNVLQAQAQAQLAQRSLERTTESLNLARAKYSVGQGTLVDVRRAEVDKGRGEVAHLKADQAVQNAILVLFVNLGVPAPEPLNLQLSDSFPVTEPAWTQQQLVDLSLERNPTLLAARAASESSTWGLRAARSQFLPSLFFQGGLGGFRTEIAGASTGGKNPFSFTLGASLPIYDGFSRSNGIQLAKAQQDDQLQAVRRTELLLRSNVAAAFQGLVLTYRTIDIERQNKVAAAEALDLATQRYRVGSGTYIELLTARDAADQADAAFVNSVYDYHKAIATLENAVGRPLR